MKYIIMMFALTGCSEFYPNGYIDPAFMSYVNTFELHFGVIHDINITFSKLGSNPLGETVGECSYDFPTRNIRIDPNFWVTMNESGKEQLILHELGHCALDIHGHDFRLGTVGDYWDVPLSIMYPWVFGDSQYYIDNRSYYIGEL